MTPEERAALEARLAEIQRQKAELAAPVDTTTDVVKAMAYAPGKAATGLVGLPGDVASLAELGRGKLDQYLPDWMVKADKAMNPARMLTGILPRSQQLRGVAEQLTGPWYDPQTRTGKIADTATQTALTMGRNWATAPMKSALLTAGVTGGTEGAGALSNDNPWARFAGGLIGGAPSALASSLASKPGATLRSAFGDLTPQEIAAAIALQERGKQVGVPLTGVESLDRGYPVVAAAMQDPKAAQHLRQFLAQRPGQVEQAVESTLLAPTGPRDVPAANAARAQEAATNALTQTERGVSAESGPLYQAAAKDQVPKEKVAALVDKARGIAASDKTGIISPVISNWISNLMTAPETPAITGIPGKMGQGRWIPGTPDVPAQPARYVTDIENLDTARQFWRDKVQLPFVAAEAVPKKTAGKIKSLNAELKSTMEEASPTWAEARQAHQDLTRQRVEPLLSSGVGKVAGRGYDPAVAPAVERSLSVLSDTNARPQTIRTVHQSLNAQDPRAFPGVVQTYIENAINKATGDIMSGPASTAGAKFRLAVAGTGIERDNFNEMMRGVAQARGVNPDELVRGANTLFSVLERTGRPSSTVSPTAGAGEIADKLGRTMIGDIAQTASFTPLHPWAHRYDKFFKAGRYEAIAKALTDPNSVQVLVKMAKLAPDGITARYLTAQLLGLDRALQ